MSKVDELKAKNENLFERNTILFNENERLRKENAELKKENKTLRIHQTNAVLEGLEMEVLKNSHRDRANNLQDQLTKAKEIIREFVFLLTHSRTALDTKTVMQKAEQFLKEIEE